MIALVALVLACKSEHKEAAKRVHPPPPKVDGVAPACVGVAARAREQYLDRADQAPTDGIRSYSEYMADAVVRVYETHCTVDKWSPQSIECAKAGKTNCDAMLTPDQLDKLQKDPKINL